MSSLKKFVAMTGIATLALMASSQAQAKPLRVVSTFSIISDFADNVGGDRIALTTLVGPDGDAHVYEPKPADVAAVGNADVVLANGLQLEGFLGRLVKASGSKAAVVELTQGIKPLPNMEDDHDSHNTHEADEPHALHAHRQGDEHTSDHHHHHGQYDPHAWQSVHNAQIYVSNIAKAFCTADKDGCSIYQANAKSYREKLQALEKNIKATMATIPSDKRTIITSHDAFGYLGHEYGLQLLAPQGISTESEASAGSVAALIEQVKARKASAIFVENISNPRLVRQIANETGIKMGGKLYSDALSSASGPASTYIDMMLHNINTIRDALARP